MRDFRDTEKNRNESVRTTEIQFVLLWGWSNGLTNQKLADRLGMSRDGVVSASQRLYRKFGARGQSHAVAMAYQWGLLDVGLKSPCRSDLAALWLLKNWAENEAEEAA